ncbi:hypothetical protein ACFO3C_21075 [Halostagnicola sp. GCM10023398]|uniref:hypothetical protein n=2 Tax=Natrialbaceae TaxID=1644061 RepID=UPI00361A5603
MLTANPVENILPVDPAGKHSYWKRVSRYLIAPVEMGRFESEQAAALERDVEKIVDHHGISVELATVRPNKVDQRTSPTDAILEAYTGAIASAHVSGNQDIRNVADDGQTLFAFEEPSQTATRARGCSSRTRHEFTALGGANMSDELEELRRRTERGDRNDETT